MKRNYIVSLRIIPAEGEVVYVDGREELYGSGSFRGKALFRGVVSLGDYALWKKER